MLVLVPKWIILFIIYSQHWPVFLSGALICLYASIFVSVHRWHFFTKLDVYLCSTQVLDVHAYEARQIEYALKGHRHFYFMTLNGSEVLV